MGSWEYSLPSLSLYGSVESNGQSSTDVVTNASIGGPGGGSGGTILLFVRALSLAESSILSSVGGLGNFGSGGGGGGRIHFHWSNIPTGDEYVPVAAVKGSIRTRSDSFSYTCSSILVLQGNVQHCDTSRIWFVSYNLLSFSMDPCDGYVL